MKYIFCTIAIGAKYLESAINLSKQFNSVSKKHHFLIVCDSKEHELENTSFVKINEDKKTFIHNYFNYNLKHIPLKICASMNYDYVIFIDADWSLNEEYSEQKIESVLNFMESNAIDFCFERPHLIGHGKYHDNLIFWKHKRDFYNLLDTDEYDEGHVVNEQFLIFKNNDKFKKFCYFWESLSDKASEGNLWAFAEGVEIGMSSAHSKMKYDYIGWQKILSNCFIFTSKDGSLYKRF